MGAKLVGCADGAFGTVCVLLCITFRPYVCAISVPCASFAAFAVCIGCGDTSVILLGTISFLGALSAVFAVFVCTCDAGFVAVCASSFLATFVACLAVAVCFGDAIGPCGIFATESLIFADLALAAFEVAGGGALFDFVDDGKLASAILRAGCGLWAA